MTTKFIDIEANLRNAPVGFIINLPTFAKITERNSLGSYGTGGYNTYALMIKQTWGLNFITNSEWFKQFNELDISDIIPCVKFSSNESAFSYLHNKEAGCYYIKPDELNLWFKTETLEVPSWLASNEAIKASQRNGNDKTFWKKVVNDEALNFYRNIWNEVRKTTRAKNQELIEVTEDVKNTKGVLELSTKLFKLEAEVESFRNKLKDSIIPTKAEFRELRGKIERFLYTSREVERLFPSKRRVEK